MAGGTPYRCPKCPRKHYYGVYVASYAIKKKPPVKCTNCGTECVPVDRTQTSSTVA